MSVDHLAAIERQLAVVRALVAVNLALTIGVLWVTVSILGRVPR